MVVRGIADLAYWGLRCGKPTAGQSRKAIAMRYAKPQTVAEAASLLSEEEGLAGGTDMLVQMKSGVIEPDLLFDVRASVISD